MNRLISFTLILLLLVIPSRSNGQTLKQSGNYLRFMSCSLSDPGCTSSDIDSQDLGKAICRSQADFVALQNIVPGLSNVSREDILRDIALESRMYPVFDQDNLSGSCPGIGILASAKPLSVRFVRLPGKGTSCGLLIAEYERLVFSSIALSPREEDQEESLPIILSEMKDSGKPFVLAGNWNTKPESHFVQQIQKECTILNSSYKPTYPSTHPLECIDYIAMSVPQKDSFVKRFENVLDSRRFSHRPVSAGVQLLIPEDEMFLYPPYLQNPTDEGITVMAQTSGIAECWVEYGPDTLHLQQLHSYYAGQVICHDIEHKFHLQGLKGGETYYYRVCAKEIVESQAYHKTFGNIGKTPFYHFTLPKKDTKNFTALIVNDLHDNKPTIDILSGLASDISYDFVICNGDCLPEPSDRNHAMRMISTINQAFGGSDHPMFFIRGNHEIRNAYSSGMPSLIENPGGKEYGAFNWGDTRFVFLDCGEDKPDDFWVYYGLNNFDRFRAEQVDFLKEEIHGKEFRRADRHILINHIPIWGDNGKYEPCKALWGKTLSKANFDIDIAAHMHRMKYYETGKIGNPFPVLVGGGPQYEHARLIILQKNSKNLKITVLDTKGKVVFSTDL